MRDFTCPAFLCWIEMELDICEEPSKPIQLAWGFALSVHGCREVSIGLF